MSTAPIPWKHVRNVLVIFAPLWVGATILFGMMGLVYALLSSDVYSARQAIVVRNEATTSLERLGRFGSQTELKAAQETILEMTQSAEVVSAALREIGPPTGKNDPNWPTTDVVDGTCKDLVNLLAPQGSEFGNTEVVYLQVKATSQQRAKLFCKAMFENLTKHLRNIRTVRGDSIVVELSHARELAHENLKETSSRMQKFEVEFGTDLGELRNLNETISGDGTNRRALEETVRELQLAELQFEKLQALQELLVAGAKNPDHLLVSGSELLTMQPSLLRLKDGLIDAQITSSQLSANRTEDHPAVINARATERQIRNRMQEEATSAVHAMQSTMRLEYSRITQLRERRDQFSERLRLLAGARTDYSNLDAELKHRTRLLEEAERALAEAKASRSAAVATNLIAALGPPQVSERPIGPGGIVLSIGSASAGLLFGLGAVFLIAPGPQQQGRGRRWSDFLHKSGRRASDIVSPVGGIAEPAVASPGPPPTGDRRSSR